MKKILQISEDDALERLRSFCPELFDAKEVRYIKPFMCPISLVEADVQEYLIDEYDSVELLVLRLYAASIRDAETIALMTGIDQDMVEKILQTEIYTYHHIDEKSRELTITGERTLADNENAGSDNLVQHGIYDTKRELQVESVTGTLVKAEAEVSNMRGWDPSDRTEILPREKTVIEKDLEKEIHDRLQTYINDDKMFRDGSTIHDIERLQTKDVKYRKAFCILIKEFQYPFVAVFYNKRGTGNKTPVVVRPTAISQCDAERIDRNQIKGKYLVRGNENFQYLKDAIEKI